MRWSAALPLALALCLPAALHAQIGSTTDIITGTVTGADGRPVPNAQVEVLSLELETTRSRTTNDRGQFTILFPDGGGRYDVTVRAVGYAPSAVQVVRQAEEDRLVVNVRMSATPTQLQAVVVQARPPVPSPDRPEPGAVERAIMGELAARLPIDAGDLAQLALLAPGVVAVDGTDTTAAGFSVAGQRADMNQVTLDGLTFGAAAVPEEAVRATRVITNTYDVSRGQFSGGQVASSTRRGSNVPQGSFSYSLRDPSLQWTDEDEVAFGQTYRQHQLSGGFGGPIVRNRAFGFASVQLRRRTSDLPTLFAATPATLARLGIAPDSVDRFFSLLRGHGLDAGLMPGIPSDRGSDNVSFVGRMDYRLNASHSLALRGDVRWGEQLGTRISTLAVPHSGGDTRSLGGGTMVTVTSQFGASFINELRAYGSLDGQRGTPYLAVPDGRVRIRSELEDGTVGFTTLGFGGNTGLPSRSDSRGLEVTNELSWISSGGAHRFKLGGLLNVSEAERLQASNRSGSFTFNSLEDFAANQPAMFTRTLSERVRTGGTLTSAGYLGDTWRMNDALQLNYGLRLEGSRFVGTPRYNARVDELFGVRTDDFPTDLRLSPRIGFSYVAQGAEGRRGMPRLVVRGGVGEFRGRTPEQLFTAALDANGLGDGLMRLTCVGSGVPTPDWSGYLADPSTIPTTCAEEVGTIAPQLGSRPAVAVFARDFAAPRSLRSSLGVSRQFRQRFSLNVDGTFTRGVAQYGVNDLNLVDAPRFTLAEEGGRPVYVPAAAITPGTGAVPLAASRVHDEFAQVLRVHSGLASETFQLTTGLGGFTMRGIMFNASYTWMRSRDQSSFSGGSALGAFGSATTAGDPNVREWGTSDLERRHNMVGTLTWPLKPWMELTTVARVSSGRAYTPRVGGDVNGDGARNDRAFVFDPAMTADTTLANGMTRLLATASPSTRACLQRQLGSVAARNSCDSPWFPSLDLRLNMRPDVAGLDRRLTLSLIAVNPLTGLDQVLHGSANMRGWGQPARPDATLLEVRGFDAGAQRFVYAVNERFGDSRNSRTAFRAPFQLALQGRFQVGRDPVRERMDAFLGRGGRGAMGAGGAGRGPGGQGAGGGGAGDFRSRLARLAPNPFVQILALRDSLQLTEPQVQQLTRLSETMATRNDSLADAVEKAMAAAQQGGARDIGSILGTMRPAIEGAQRNLERALGEAREVLTPEQWARVPESVKNPTASGFQGAPGALRGGRPGAGRPPTP